MTNSPLLDKFYELYPEKKEQLKPKPEPEEDTKFFLPKDFIEQINNKIPDPVTVPTTSPSVATSNTGITKASPIKTYDPDSVNVSFHQVVEQVKNGEATVSSMSIEIDIMSATKLTFEIIVYEP
jgi:hypothetical protein